LEDGKLRIGKLTAMQVARATKRGMLNDGAGLYLQIQPGGSKSWLLRYKRGGKTSYMGLGPLHTIGLSEARQKAAEARRLLLDGKDPLAARRASRAAQKAAMTFRELAVDYVKSHAPGWRSSKHLRQWESTLATYAYPVIGDMAPDAIETADVLRVLKPIWVETPVSASRLRNRIELILDAAKAKGLRSGENPAAWRGHLDKLLPARSKVRPVVHHPAMPYAKVAALVAALRDEDGGAARALQFLILTATRSGETLGATWDEVDLEQKLWTIPAERMKALREHRIPLSDPALAILTEMAAIRSSDFVFPGRLHGRPLSGEAMKHVLRRLGLEGVTVHGFRSAFRDFAGNETNVAREVAEAALAHAVGDATETAYRRDDALDKRRRLMDAWAAYCSGRGQVILFKTSVANAETA
jgi:integrase